MLVSLTVGKVDAGVAVLLTEDKRLVGSDGAPQASALLSLNPILPKPLPLTASASSLDRIPLGTPPARYNQRLDSRRDRDAQPRLGSRIRRLVRPAANPNPPDLRRTLTQPAGPPLPQRDPDIRSSGMGSVVPGNGAVPLPRHVP